MNRNNAVILAHIQRRIKRNANALVLVIGDVGSGKTYFCLDFALTIANLFQTGFDESWVNFDAKDFFEATMREHKAGQPILADEFGVTMSARMSSSKVNRAISFLLQTCRFKNHIILFTVPKLSFVDVHARRLFHYKVIVKPRFKNNKNYVNIQALSELESWKRGKSSFIVSTPVTYRDTKSDEIRYASTYESSLPPKELIDSYEKKRNDFITKLYEEQSVNLGIEKGSPGSPLKLVTKICKICGRLQEIDPKIDNHCDCGAFLIG